MAFDVKKEYKDLYQPAATPSIIEVPRMRFVAVEGSGDPNEEDDDYQTALQLLYGVSFTIKMSRKSKDPAEHIEGYYDYVVPPLEGLWHMDTNDNETGAIDYSRKTDFQWTSMIRLPEFVTDEAFDACVSVRRQTPRNGCEPRVPAGLDRGLGRTGHAQRLLR